MSIPLRLQQQHFLSIKNFTKQDFLYFFDDINQISQTPIKYQSILDKEHVSLLFFENSTRTSSSFEMAVLKLGGYAHKLNMQYSAISKGETLGDTVKNLYHIGHRYFVIRHPTNEFYKKMDTLSNAYKDLHILNAGDGTNEHPSQVLSDLYTIIKLKGDVKYLKITIVGDLLYSRIADALIHSLKILGCKNISLCAPYYLMTDNFSNTLGIFKYEKLSDALEKSDVIFSLRVQKERISQSNLPDIHDYFTSYGLTEEKLRNAQKGHIIMHPGPVNRGIDMMSNVCDGQNSAIMKQVEYGVFTRMAILKWLKNY